VEGIIIIPIHKKGDKTDCNNYQRISLLSTAYKSLPNILLARLTAYVNEGIVDTGLEVNAEKTKYMIMSCHPNSGQNQNIRIANESFENVAKFK
jgi:hypothetical protein